MGKQRAAETARPMTQMIDGRALESSDFGAKLESVPVERRIVGLGLPPPTEMINVSNVVRSDQSVLKDARAARAELGWVARSAARRVASEAARIVEVLEERTNALAELEAERAEAVSRKREAQHTKLDLAVVRRELESPANILEARERVVVDWNRAKLPPADAPAPASEARTMIVERVSAHIVSPESSPHTKILGIEPWYQRMLRSIAVRAPILARRARRRFEELVRAAVRWSKQVAREAREAR